VAGNGEDLPHAGSFFAFTPPRQSSQGGMVAGRSVEESVQEWEGGTVSQSSPRGREVRQGPTQGENSLTLFGGRRKTTVFTFPHQFPCVIGY
jgi:hypothetical protein